MARRSPKARRPRSRPIRGSWRPISAPPPRRLEARRTAMLKIQDVHLAYGPISAVRKATIEVEAGEVVAIVGGNGAGKSTLLKGIAGLMPVSSGQILFEKED